VNRQPDGERAPLAELALQQDLASQQFRQLLDDRESQAGPFVFTGQGIADFLKQAQTELRPLGVACNIQCQYCYQNPQRDAGNLAVAQRRAGEARTWTLWAAGLGLAGYVLWGLFVVALAPMTTF
jgi:hypothetical protein